MNKYRLIILGDPWDVFQIAHKDWIENPAITYIPTFRPNGLLGLIQRLQFNPKINAIISMPWKSYWNRYTLRHITGERLCFLITGFWLRHECGIRLLPYLRNRYPQAHIVCFLQDLIATVIDHYSHKIIDIDYIKKYSNLIICYDKNDAKKYDIQYHSTVFSPIQIAESVTDEQWGLYFLGRDKGRLPLLIDICKEAKKRKISCKIILIEVPEERRIACEGIVYVDKEISYYENLRNSSASKCILEVLQHAAVSASFRTWEAIMLNKKLITNNLGIKDSEAFDTQYISVFHDLTDFDWNFIEEGNPYPDGNPYQERIRPNRLIEFIEEKLNIKIEHT